MLLSCDMVQYSIHVQYGWTDMENIPMWKTSKQTTQCHETVRVGELGLQTALSLWCYISLEIHYLWMIGICAYLVFWQVNERQRERAREERDKRFLFKCPSVVLPTCVKIAMHAFQRHHLISLKVCKLQKLVNSLHCVQNIASTWRSAAVILEEHTEEEEACHQRLQCHRLSLSWDLVGATWKPAIPLNKQLQKCPGKWGGPCSCSD